MCYSDRVSYLDGLFGHAVKYVSALLPQRSFLRFTSPAVATDNPGENATDVTVDVSAIDTADLSFPTIALGTGTQPSNDPIIGISDPGAPTPVITVETSGNDVDVLSYDPGGGSPSVIVGGGAANLQEITLDADVRVKVLIGSTELRVEASQLKFTVGGVVYIIDATGISRNGTAYTNP